MRTLREKHATGRPLLWVVVAAVAVAAGTLLLLPFEAAANRSFVAICGFSHRANDDPIVYPQQPGVSHAHDFYGARTTDANSNTASLQASETTCNIAGDTAAYWHPTVFAKRTGESLRGRLFAYYETGGKDPDRIRKYPKGLRVLAGRSTATSAQSTSRIWWKCVGEHPTRRLSYPPQCSVNSSLTANILFPDCWNGSTLDSLDHRSHMAYRKPGNVCPSTHRVYNPVLRMVVVLKKPESPQSIRLASGAHYTLHADFYNAWDSATLQSLVRRCLVGGRPC